MEKTYYTKTIEECEKQIVDKCIDLDIVYSTNVGLLECFTRMIRTIFTWFSIISISVVCTIYGFKQFIVLGVILLTVFVASKLLISWVKFNYNEYYDKMKFNLVDGLIIRCQEYQEGQYEDWQKKQMLKRFANLANIVVDWDNVK